MAVVHGREGRSAAWGTFVLAAGALVSAMAVGCQVTEECCGTQEGPSLTTGPYSPDESGAVPAPGTRAHSPEREPPVLCINEFMPSNEGALTRTGSTPDWIEIHNLTDAPVALTGWTLGDDLADPSRHTFAGDLAVPGGGYLLLFADGAPEQGEAHLNFRLSVGGESLVLTSPQGRQSTLHYPELEADVSAFRTKDCCRGEGCWSYGRGGTPGATNAGDASEPEDVDLLLAGSSWRYHDLAEAPEPGWRGAGYDDSSWGEGPGPLGYGDKHIATETGYGPDKFAKPMTTYFRTSFEVDDPSALEGLTLWLMRDDGAVVHLNDAELMRSNMPPGPIDADTSAVDTIWKVEDEARYVATEVDVRALIKGSNQLAVEVHQAIPDSSDLGFDLAVTARRVTEVPSVPRGESLAPWVPSETLPPYVPILPRPCPEIYDPDTLPEFHIEVDEEEWAALRYEYSNGGYGPMGTELKPYHPLESFSYDGEVIEDAEIRLKGWPGSYVDWGKMQFVIRFHGVDPSARFMGLRRLALDSPYYEPSLLRERLSLTYFQEDLGLPGSCANNARLVVNGEFYGLYTNIEYLDEELLERLFGNDGPDEGYLYKYVPDHGWKLKEGGAEDDLAAIDALYTLYETEAITEVVDEESLLRFGAAEATLPDEDNYFVGSINFAWYQHPERGWVPLPWDHDWSFLTSDLDPLNPPFTWLNEHLWVLVHSPWSSVYEEALKVSVDTYSPALFRSRLHAWADQVRPSVEEDPTLSLTEFEAEVERLEAFFWARQAYLDTVLEE